MPKRPPEAQDGFTHLTSLEVPGHFVDPRYNQPLISSSFPTVSRTGNPLPPTTEVSPPRPQQQTTLDHVGDQDQTDLGTTDARSWRERWEADREPAWEDRGGL